MSSKRKLVWVDERKLPRMAPNWEEWSQFLTAMVSAKDGDYVRLKDVLSLPDALLVSEGDREALAHVFDPDMDNDAVCGLGDGAIWRGYMREMADKALAAGYRKVTALDRETLVEEIAKALCEGDWDVEPEGGRKGYRDEARTLISRAEGTV